MEYYIIFFGVKASKILLWDLKNVKYFIRQSYTKSLQMVLRQDPILHQINLVKLATKSPRMEDRNESFSNAIKQKVFYCSVKNFYLSCQQFIIRFAAGELSRTLQLSSSK